jgi:hypothetical protein
MLMKLPLKYRATQNRCGGVTGNDDGDERSKFVKPLQTGRQVVPNHISW